MNKDEKAIYIKLAYQENIKVYLQNEPDYYKELLNLPFEVIFDDQMKAMNYDLIHVFVKSIKDLREHEAELQKYMKRDGMIWVSWPKGDKYINRDMIRQFMLSRDLVDVKVASFDDTWSCLKFVVPLNLR